MRFGHANKLQQTRAQGAHLAAKTSRLDAILLDALGQFGELFGPGCEWAKVDPIGIENPAGFRVPETLSPAIVVVSMRDEICIRESTEQELNAPLAAAQKIHEPTIGRPDNDQSVLPVAVMRKLNKIVEQLPCRAWQCRLKTCAYIFQDLLQRAPRRPFFEPHIFLDEPFVFELGRA